MTFTLDCFWDWTCFSLTCTTLSREAVLRARGWSGPSGLLMCLGGFGKAYFPAQEGSWPLGTHQPLDSLLFILWKPLSSGTRTEFNSGAGWYSGRLSYVWSWGFLKAQGNKLFLQHEAGEVFCQSSPNQSTEDTFCWREAGETSSWGDSSFPGHGSCNHTHSSQQQTLSTHEHPTPPSCQHCKNWSPLKIDLPAFSQWSRLMVKLHLFLKSDSSGLLWSFKHRILWAIEISSIGWLWRSQLISESTAPCSTELEKACLR